MEYKVRFCIDDIYEVIKITVLSDYYMNLLVSEQEQEECVFRGSISDCEAFIRLSEKGHLES